MNEPKLRFPEFSGEWEEKTLVEECEITAGGDIPKEKISKEKTEIYKVPIISNGIGNNAIYGYTDSPKITQAAITISARGTIGYAEYREYPYYPIVRLLSVFPKDSTSLNTKYLSYILSIQKYDVTNAGIPQLTVPMIGSVIFHIPPSPAEQRKIASCLSAMDDLIAAQAEKVEALKEKKTGLMQQMFPQAGETTPRLRFPEFTGEWEMKKLGEILVERKEVSVITRELPQLSFTIAEGVIKPEDRKTNQRDFLMIDKDNKRFSVTRRHDIIYNPANVVYGAIHKNNLCDGVVSPIYKIFWTKENADFINHLLRRPEFITQLASRAEGTVTKLKTLKAEAFLDMFVPFPITPSEQEKIADCLSALDAQIAAETEKLTALKDYKKGLMQQLFPQPAK